MALDTAVALWAYIAKEDNELSLKPGDHILITEKCNKDWYEGNLNGKIAFFPANYVRVIAKTTSSLADTQNTKQNDQNLLKQQTEPTPISKPFKQSETDSPPSNSPHISPSASIKPGLPKRPEPAKLKTVLVQLVKSKLTIGFCFSSFSRNHINY
jgi:hypothetical protein